MRTAQPITIGLNLFTDNVHLIQWLHGKQQQQQILLLSLCAFRVGFAHGQNAVYIIVYTEFFTYFNRI